MTTFKNIASNLLAGIIFILVPSLIGIIVAGYKELGEYMIYGIILISGIYYFLNKK